MFNFTLQHLTSSQLFISTKEKGVRACTRVTREKKGFPAAVQADLDGAD